MESGASPTLCLNYGCTGTVCPILETESERKQLKAGIQKCVDTSLLRFRKSMISGQTASPLSSVHQTASLVVFKWYFLLLKFYFKYIDYRVCCSSMTVGNAAYKSAWSSSSTLHHNYLVITFIFTLFYTRAHYIYSAIFSAHSANV